MSVDTTGCDAALSTIKELQSQGITFAFGRVRDEVRERMQIGGIEAVASTGNEQCPGGDDAKRACLQGDGTGLVAEVAQMTVDHVRGDEEPAALDRSGYHFDDISRPGAPSQPSLRRGIAQVEMDPHKIRAARRGIGLRKIIHRPPSSVCAGSSGRRGSMADKTSTAFYNL